jgi:hypothetical protein
MKQLKELIIILILVIAYFNNNNMYYALSTILGKSILLGIIILLTALMPNLGICIVLILFIFNSQNIYEGLENNTSNNHDNKHDNKDDNKHDNKHDNKDDNKPHTLTEINDAVASFKKKYCVNGQLINNKKEKIILSDINLHFPQIVFDINNKCNPCNNDCLFKITSGDELLSTDELLRSKNSTLISVE